MKNRFQPNDFSFSAERFYAFHKKSEKTPLVTSSTRASSQDNPKKEAFFLCFPFGVVLMISILKNDLLYLF